MREAYYPTIGQWYNHNKYGRVKFLGPVSVNDNDSLLKCTVELISGEKLECSVLGIDLPDKNLVSEGVILGVLPSMKNSRVIGRISQRGRGRFGKKRPILMKSVAARNYVESALPQIPLFMRKNFDQDVALTVFVYYPNRRHDVDCELLCDVLQKAGVIKNDRQIRVKHFYGHLLDKINPRVEWKIEVLKKELA